MHCLTVYVHISAMDALQEQLDLLVWLDQAQEFEFTLRRPEQFFYKRDEVGPCTVGCPPERGGQCPP